MREREPGGEFGGRERAHSEVKPGLVGEGEVVGGETGTEGG